MSRRFRSPWVRIVGVALILVVAAVAGFGLFLAGEAGQLPWQEDPTRIPITPFADIPGFGAPTSTSTPTPGS